jgi:hypothetical protein
VKLRNSSLRNLPSLPPFRPGKLTGRVAPKGLPAQETRWTDTLGKGYLRGMHQRAAEFERRYWHLVKEGGKSRFLRREILGAFVQWSLLAAASFLFRDHPLSLESIGFIDLALLPVFLIWGFLNAGWKWKGMGKKYPE